MKIAIVTWLINDVGGINSWGENAVKGLSRLGHEATVFHATSQRTLNCDPEKKVRRNSRYDLLPGHHLSYRTETLKESVETLNEFDLIIFLHPSPHPTKAILGSKDALNWKELYLQPTPRKVVIFHDENWEKTNSWFAEVAPYVDAAMAAQHRFLPSVERYPAACPKWWDFFPLDLNYSDELLKLPKDGADYGIIATQWLKWKNHHKLVPHLGDVQIPMRLFGAGQEYHNLLDELETNIRYNHKEGYHCNPKAIHEYFGFVSYDRLLREMRGAKLSIDLSTKGYTNMSHWEPLAVGTLAVMEERVMNDPFNEIPEDCAVVFELDNVAEALNELHKWTRSDWEPYVNRGLQYIQESACEKVMERLLRKVEL